MAKAATLMRKWMSFVDWLGWHQEIRVLAIPLDETRYERLYEGHWIDGRFEKNIRLDRATHLRSGDLHAHVLGRKGETIVVVNFDGSASHGSYGRLHHDDAEALRAKGFQIHPDNLVEWWELEELEFRVLLTE